MALFYSTIILIILFNFTQMSIILAQPQNISETTSNAKVNHKKLHIAVYYESLCPDSISFISDQLIPNYESFKNHIDLLLVPFGKSESEDNGTAFYCQHGPAECTGNRMQSCVLDKLYDQNAKIQFIDCQMRYSAEFSGKVCAESVNVTYDELLDCLTTQKGVNLQLEAEKETHLIARPYPRFIPTIVYNKIFNASRQRRSLTEFSKVVCAELTITLNTNEIPAVCISNTK